VAVIVSSVSLNGTPETKKTSAEALRWARWVVVAL